MFLWKFSTHELEVAEAGLQPPSTILMVTCGLPTFFFVREKWLSVLSRVQ
jgi:hypothetical protein